MSLAFDHLADGATTVGRRGETPQRQPVVLRGRPLVGHLPELRKDPLRFFSRVARDHGDVVELHFGLDKVLMLNHPAMIRHVLQDNRLNYEKSKFYDVMRGVLGNGIFLADARAPIEDVEAVLGVSLVPEEREEDADSLGGLIVSMLGRVPVRGELLRHPAGIELEILEADPRRVKKIRINARPKPQRQRRKETGGQG